MAKFCVAWSNHNWIRAAANDVSRYCSKCGLVEPWVERRTGVAPPWVELHRRKVARTAARRVPTPPSTPPLTPLQRRRAKVLYLFRRDGEGCFYCRSPLEVDDAVLDHFIPRSAGGGDRLPNRRASCVRCDKRKRDRLPWVFMPDRFPEPPLDELADVLARKIEVGSIRT